MEWGKRYLKVWEQDLILRDAFQYSCVPCYQELARKIGHKRMNQYLKKLDYGKMKVDSTNIDSFWLKGDSHINQFQQISFLNRFYESKLDISKRTERIVKRLMLIQETPEFRLSGKTGWSIKNGIENGWFVGFINKKDNVYYFATNIEPKREFDMKLFAMIRKDITFEALRNIGVIN